MNKTIKLVLLIVGLAIAGYGVFMLIQPETDISIGDLNLVQAQDNTNAFITIGIGVVTMVLSLLGGKK